MELKAILEAIELSCDGKDGSDEVQVPAELLLAAQKELKGKSQMARDLEMARDEASMKPSVARKLNEKIRALEAELEELRSNKKVKELEKKVQFLEHELKQSYTTKNFTLKSGLLELEKQYRPQMNVDPAMAAFWDDITVLLDEKKERDGPGIPRLPRGTGASSADSTGFRTPRLSTGSLTPTPPTTTAGAAAAGETAAAASTDPSPTSQAPPSPSSSAAKAAGPQPAAVSSGVQSQVETYNTIISEEAASAAALPADLSAGRQESGEVVLRHGAGFRVVRPAGAPEPQADAAAAADSGKGVDGAGQESAEARQQHVQLIRQEFASRVQDVSFHAMPVSQHHSLASTTAASAQPTPALQSLEQQSRTVTSSIQALLQEFSGLQGEAAGNLPQPPVLVSAAGSQQEQQAAAADPASQWQQQLQQLLLAAQALQQVQQDPLQSALELEHQQATTGELLQSVSQMHAALQHSSQSNDTADQQLATATQELATLKQELLQLQQCQTRAAAEAAGQQLLLDVFQEFLAQLEQQSVLAPGAAATVAAAAAGGHQSEQQALLVLLQSFLRANPQVPQLLAVQLAPAVPAQQQEQPEEAPAAEVSSSAVQASVDAEHRETQYEPAQTQHVSTQSDTDLTRPSDHAETQTEQQQQVTSHASTQASTESVSAGMQTNPPSPVAAAVQAELRPEMSDAGAQVDLPAAKQAAAPAPPEELTAAAPAKPPAAASTAAKTGTGSGSSSDASRGPEITAESPPDSPELQHSRRHGSGIIYSASGSELSVNKAAVGQQLDILHRIERSRAGGAPGDGEGGAAVAEVKPEELEDLGAVAKELSQLRADNMELAANLQVTQSLVDHLNTNLKSAIDKADDAEAEAVLVKQQLNAASASLLQLQSEHAELTHVLIEAKVEIAEKKGELLKLIRDLKRAISNPVQNAAGVVKELENILAVVPAADEDADVAHGPAVQASRQGSSVDSARSTGLAGLAAGLGHMRDALGGLGAALPAGRGWPGAGQGGGDGGSAPVAAAGAAEGQSAAAAAVKGTSQPQQQ